MKIKKTCSNCIKGKKIPVNDDIFCLVKGAVTPDFVCSQHKFAPIKKSKMKDMGPKCIDCINFVTRNNNPDDLNIGVCRLFSVRLFDGTLKNACSKFQKKESQEVV